MEGPEVDSKLLQELKHRAHAPERHLQLAQGAVLPRPYLHWQLLWIPRLLQAVSLVTELGITGMISRAFAQAGL